MPVCLFNSLPTAWRIAGSRIEAGNQERDEPRRSSLQRKNGAEQDCQPAAQGDAASLGVTSLQQ